MAGIGIAGQITASNPSCLQSSITWHLKSYKIYDLVVVTKSLLGNLSFRKDKQNFCTWEDIKYRYLKTLSHKLINDKLILLRQQKVQFMIWSCTRSHYMSHLIIYPTTPQKAIQNVFLRQMTYTTNANRKIFSVSSNQSMLGTAVGGGYPSQKPQK